MDELAEAAAVGKATLYRYFPSKEDLYLAVFARALDQVTAALDQAAESGSAKESLVRMIGTLVTALAEHLRGLRSVEDGQAQVAERKRRLFQSRRHHITSRIERVLVEGIARGEFRPVRASACAQLIVGMIRSSSGYIDEPTDQAAHTIADLFLNGVLAAPIR
jgi:AcrR family transcriptional regulator